MIAVDIVMSVAIFLFVPALLPSILSKREKPPRTTCLFTALLLSVISVCFAMNQMWIPFISEVISALAWWILLFQRRVT